MSLAKEQCYWVSRNNEIYDTHKKMMYVLLLKYSFKACWIFFIITYYPFVYNNIFLKLNVCCCQINVVSEPIGNAATQLDYLFLLCWRTTSMLNRALNYYLFFINGLWRQKRWCQRSPETPGGVYRSSLYWEMNISVGTHSQMAQRRPQSRVVSN